MLFRNALPACHGLLPSLVFSALLLSACNNSNTPLDADTRQAIDSLAAQQIRQARAEMDSLCKQRNLTQLPQLVDSMKKVRLREIQEQLRTVPK